MVFFRRPRCFSSPRIRLRAIGRLSFGDRTFTVSAVVLSHLPVVPFPTQLKTVSIAFRLTVLRTFNSFAISCALLPSAYRRRASIIFSRRRASALRIAAFPQLPQNVSVPVRGLYRLLITATFALISGAPKP
jgi:hypothetical protein